MCSNTLFHYLASIEMAVFIQMAGLAVANETNLPVNFHTVTTNIFRSAQPDAEQMKNIEAQDIKSVLNLRYWHTDNDESAGTHLSLYHIPMDAANIEEDKVIQALQVIKSAEKPLLVHCWHGSDRTGLVIAMYRLVFENQDKEQVIEELRIPEYGYHDVFYPAIIDYIRDVDVDAIRQQVLGSDALTP